MMIESAREPRLGLLSRVSRPTSSMLIAPLMSWPVAPVLPSRSTVLNDLLMSLTIVFTKTMAVPAAIRVNAPNTITILVHSGPRGLPLRPIFGGLRPRGGLDTDFTPAGSRPAELLPYVEPPARPAGAPGGRASVGPGELG